MHDPVYQVAYLVVKFRQCAIYNEEHTFTPHSSCLSPSFTFNSTSTNFVHSHNGFQKIQPKVIQEQTFLDWRVTVSESANSV